jgi:hypothetical protein
MKNIFLISFCAFFFLPPSPAYAHDSTLTYSSISITDKTINVAITTPYKNILDVYPDKDKAIDPDSIGIEDVNLEFFTRPFSKGFLVTNNGERCAPKLTNIQKIDNIKEVAYQYEFTCKKPFDKLHFSYDLFFNLSYSHENITDIYMDDFGTQIIFSKKLPSYDLSAGEMRNKTNTYHTLWNIVNFLKIGSMHIFTGYDHILFLLGLLLMAKRFRGLLKIITAFTIAHSVTLALSVLSIITLPSRFTESMIALSIIYVALENIILLKSETNTKHKNAKHKKVLNLKYLNFDIVLNFVLRILNLFNPKKLWLVAFAFGLIHGFGFSTVLRELGLPKNGLITSLISFNVGVEIGQLVIISLLFPLLWYIRKKTWSKNAIGGIAIAIGAAGLFWFIQRAL